MEEGKKVKEMGNVKPDSGSAENNKAALAYNFIWELTSLDTFLKKKKIYSPIVNRQVIATAAYAFSLLTTSLYSKWKSANYNTITVYDNSSLYKPVIYFLVHKLGIFKKISKTYKEEVENIVGTNTRGNKELDEYDTRDPNFINKEIEKIQIPKTTSKTVYFGGVKIKIQKDYERTKFSYGYTESEVLVFTYKIKDNTKLLEFFKEAVRCYFEEVIKNKVLVFKNTSYGDWDDFRSDIERSLDSVFLNPGVKEDLIKDIETFEKRKDKMMSLGIPYKRTFLLTGPPGNGKTSLVQAIATKYNKNIYWLDHSGSFNNNNLIQAFSRIEENSILLIEDSDQLFEGRERKDSAFTFDGLLNCLDGVGSKQNIWVFITTNKPEKFDKALIRSGRIDKKIFLDNPKREVIEKYYKEINEVSTVSKDFSKFLDKKEKNNESVSMADVQEKILSELKL